MIDVSNFSGKTSVAWQYIQYGHRILIMQKTVVLINSLSYNTGIALIVSRRPRTMTNIHLMLFFLSLGTKKNSHVFIYTLCCLTD